MGDRTYARLIVEAERVGKYRERLDVEKQAHASTKRSLSATKSVVTKQRQRIAELERSLSFYRQQDIQQHIEPSHYRKSGYLPYTGVNPND